MSQNVTKNSFGDLPVVSGLPRTEAECLVAQNTPLIYAVMKRRFPSLLASENKEEAVAVGLLWLWKAALRYDPAKGRFSTLAYHYICGGLMRHLQEQRRADRLPTVSLDAPIGEDGDLYELLAEEEMAAPPRFSKPGATIMASAGLESLLEGVPDGPQEVLRLLCEEGMSLTEAARTLGISRQRIEQLRDVGVEAIVSRHATGALTEYRSLRECRKRQGQNFQAKYKKFAQTDGKTANRLPL